MPISLPLPSLPSQSILACLPASAWKGLTAELSAGLHAADCWIPDSFDKAPPVGEVRELIRFAARTGVGERRLAIIPVADGLGGESANALLKLLEEPPSGLYLVLLSESGRLLPTVRSRLSLLSVKGASATMEDEDAWQRALMALDACDPASRREAARLTYIYPLLHPGIRHDLFLDHPSGPGSGIPVR